MFQSVADCEQKFQFGHVQNSISTGIESIIAISQNHLKVSIANWIYIWHSWINFLSVVGFLCHRDGNGKTSPKAATLNKIHLAMNDQHTIIHFISTEDITNEASVHHSLLFA